MGPNIYLSRQRGDEANHILAREFHTCFSGYPEIRQNGHNEHLPRTYTPLRDITGSIFEGLARESRIRSPNESSNYFMNRTRNSINVEGQRNSIRYPESRFFGFESNNHHNHHHSDNRAFNRSMSMSSPNIDIGMVSGSMNSSREMIENNSIFMNRSRSFADRIMEQFDIIEREHNQLTERIQRSQSIYEQIQRNGAEIEQLFNNLSHRIQRRHTQRENSTGYDSQFRNNRNGRSVTECGRNTRVNHRLSSRPRFVSMDDIHNHFRDHLMETEQEVEEYDHEESEVIELIQVDDDEISEIMSRRNDDIRSRSLIINQNDVLYQENEESQNSSDEQQIHEYEDSYNDDQTNNLIRAVDRFRNRVVQNQQEEIIGVPIDIQSTLPVSRFDISRSNNLDDDKKMCLICLDDFKDQQEILWLPCTHCFCRKCITSWFERGTVCPICKDDLLAHFKY